MVNLKNYIKNEEIILTKKITYHQDIEKLLCINKEIKKIILDYKRHIYKDNSLKKTKDLYVYIKKYQALELKDKEILNRYRSIKKHTLNFFAEKNYNLVFFHMTRLTENEKTDILNNGMLLPTKELLLNKINKLSIKNSFKTKLINYVNGLPSLQAENSIYFQNNIPEINKELIYDNHKIFLKDWGGETIYNFFHKKTKGSERIREAINKISQPYIILASIPFKSLSDDNKEEIIEKIILNYPYRTNRVIISPILYNTDFEIIEILPFHKESTLLFK